jgi:CRISPR-associated endonuclease Cas1
LADQNAAFLMLERNGEVLATTGPVYPSDARLRRAQAVAHQSGIALKIAKQLITQKLTAQNDVIRKYFNNSPVSQNIGDACKQIVRAKSSDELRRWEAQAALAYWSAWRAMPVVFSRVDAAKVPDHWKTFGSRVSPLTNSPRLAVNPPNAILNYLYAILEAEARLTLAELGLDPGLGVMHNDSRTRDSLACDLMEPIRPKVDALLLDLLTSGEVRREWFFEERDGNCRLLSSFAVQLSETANTWRTALGPLAEWIAGSLWDAKFRKIREQTPATRLTQRRKSEARAALLGPTDQAQVLRPRICTECNQITRSGDAHCRNCVGSRRVE